MSLDSIKYISTMMSVIKFNEAANAAAKDPKAKQLFEIFLGKNIPDTPPDDPAKGEEPFTSPLAWAYYAAYRSVILVAWMRSKLLTSGVEDVHKFLDHTGLKNTLKAALPHQSKFIDDNEPEAYYWLLDELQKKLLAELRKSLEGRESDEAEVKQAAEIMEAVKRSDKERAEQASKAASPG